MPTSAAWEPDRGEQQLAVGGIGGHRSSSDRGCLGRRRCGKKDHHAVALDASGKVLFDRSLPQDEQHLRQLITGLKVHGTVLFVVDQPATIGALPLAVARDEGVPIGYLPGLAMRRIADLHAGEAKTDARDAAIIAQAA